ncbi:MAG: hypothetical protein F4X51_03265 [Gemmatimonadetes bacterium]|nr:hypothetical protein [Gemmatimonadota bacterium]
MSQSEFFDLIKRLLGTEPSENDDFKSFEAFFDNDFMAFANEESSLADEAKAIQRLQKLEKRLEKFVKFPYTFAKRSIAIGGGFNSGKSSLVNSFIQQPNVQLPVGLNHTTKIPSYVLSSDRMSIQGFSDVGATVEIAPALYGQLTHKVIADLNFKRILPSITVEVPLTEGWFDHLCLLDTPGYNLAGGSTTKDRSRAVASLRGQDALIWVIGLDATGTVPSDDIDLLHDWRDLGLNEAPLYVVLNKADVKPSGDLQAILDEVTDTLKDEELEPVGISVYSAEEGQEYLHVGQGLEAFLRGQNKPHKPADLAEDLKLELEDIFSMYEKAIEQDEKSTKVLRDELNKLDLDLNVVGIDVDAADVLSEKIGKIKKIAQNRDFAPIKQKLAQVKQDMFSLVEAVLLSLVADDPESARTLNVVWRSPTRKEGNDASTNAGRPWYFTQATQSTGESRGSTSRHQGYIRDGKYIKTDAESLRIYEVAHEFNLSSTEMIARLRNLGFQVKDHMSVYTPVMAEAVQKELAAERWATKKNTEATSQARQLININQATAKELKRLLPGIGPKIAKRIVAYRRGNGLFRRIDDLANVQGISLKMVNQWFGYFSIDFSIVNDLHPKLERNLIHVLRQVKK